MFIVKVLSLYFIYLSRCSLSLKLWCLSLNSIVFSAAIALLCWTCIYCANMEFFSKFIIPKCDSSLVIISITESSTFSLAFLPIGRSSPPPFSFGVSLLSEVIQVDGVLSVLGIPGEELSEYAPILFTLKRLDATSVPSLHKVFHFGMSFSRSHRCMRSNLFPTLCS